MIYIIADAVISQVEDRNYWIELFFFVLNKSPEEISFDL